jgi:hypothetical protein
MSRSDRSAPRARRGRLVHEIVLALCCVPLVLYAYWRKATGESGFETLAEGELAVVEDGTSGARRVVDQPGWLFHRPWIDEVARLDKSPQVLRMQGGKREEGGVVPHLILRASDGSSFWFESLSVTYALSAETAPEALDDSGEDGLLRERLVEAHVRAILREEFGRAGPEDLARPETVTAALRASQARLAEALRPHGIVLLELSTPRPSFDKAYEDQIHRRKIADQEVLHLRAKQEQLVQERAQREATTKKEKRIELEKLASDLVRDVGVAEKDQIRARQDADNVFLEKSEAGRAGRIEKEAQAAVLTSRYTAFARDLSRQTRELEHTGELSVRTALVEKLAGIEFNLVPYNRDPSPSRVEYETVPAAAAKKGGAP